MKYICAIDPKRKAIAGQLFSDNEHSLAGRAKKWDEAGLHVYDCVAELMPGAQATGERSLDTVQSLSFLHVDIDLRALATPPDEVLAKLKALPLPVEIRNSGGGYHVIICLKEAAEAGTVEFERANAARKRLTYLLVGDPAPDHAAALLRRVGSHNFKYGKPRLCHVVQAGAPVDLTEAETLAELLGDTPLFVAKERPPKANGHDTRAPKPRVDVEADLAAMQFEGGDDGIHNVQLRCTASRLRSGISVEDVVAEMLEATREAVAGDVRCAQWDWATEKRDVERMCFDFINKNGGESPELVELLPEPYLGQWRAKEAAGDRCIRMKYSGFNGGCFVVYSRKARAAEPTETPADAPAEAAKNPPLQWSVLAGSSSSTSRTWSPARRPTISSMNCCPIRDWCLFGGSRNASKASSCSTSATTLLADCPTTTAM